MSEYVTCSVCKKRYKGKVPKGGDGSVLFPRLHRINTPVSTSLGLMPKRGHKVICPGSYKESIE